MSVLTNLAANARSEQGAWGVLTMSVSDDDGRLGGVRPGKVVKNVGHLQNDLTVQ
ncbi:hypothetical protein OCU04_000795 [Sclerotinia nivalis]|uniref:Uncharacterized protein n=1 Tax=Sclerotinia nivalis TaxID=352851 RepID=A0A9X0AWU1_9HELO|nr:hypothetical protein OCU04_000795 [Sclerotinia nivalis]